MRDIADDYYDFDEKNFCLIGRRHHNKYQLGDAIRIKVAQANLDLVRARAILASDEFAQDVRDQEAFYQANGIRSVPAVIINERYLISGGQPVEVFEQALRDSLL